ncbi:MAG: GGDEF domain-containing protein [Pseudomonadota bacterium]
MPNIDPRTVVLLAGVMSSFMALIMFSLNLRYPPSIKGLGEWGVALLLVAAGSTLAFGLGTLPSFASITLPRIFFPTGLFLGYVGAQRFFGQTPRIWPWVFLIALTVAVQTWFTYGAPDFAARLRLSGVLAVCLFVAFANLVRKQGLTSFARVLTMGVLVSMCGIVAMRLVTALIWPAGTDIYDTSAHHLVYLSALSVFILLLSVSMVLLAAERLHTEMAYLASHDSLTNALTRRQMNEVCSMELERSQRRGHSLALLIMDLDHFKAVNDTHGHQRGDRVLVDFVNRVNDLLRRPDQLARFGGEEFVALLPETTLEEALGVAERIRAACALPSAEPACTVSIGVTTNRMANDSADTLIARADSAMYKAKTKGRNRVETA